MTTIKDDHKAFRRQLEDKRPIVESNLLSGRQYVASEPPLSDTSDSEGSCHRQSFNSFTHTKLILSALFIHSIRRRFSLLIGRGSESWTHAKHSTRSDKVDRTMESFNQSKRQLEASLGWVHDGEFKTHAFFHVPVCAEESHTLAKHILQTFLSSHSRLNETRSVYG